ncbi:uncharacterized protein MKK02DRAFT_42078 [Dioszegia hungarica]|uniref:Uncharacterized protein n=1 Tax=Dioszegia hungarica TaxID=4972 RepID=A0AA38HFE6_9TREE|nr:uncharacterized protein MKK02DRAFT_42078 [Dioszegia hungarica]KAI9639037.1 hypothetical protein MKK02DRAFT_42078 [Dioszegia hungarica]
MYSGDGAYSDDDSSAAPSPSEPSGCAVDIYTLIDRDYVIFSEGRISDELADHITAKNKSELCADKAEAEMTALEDELTNLLLGPEVYDPSADDGCATARTHSEVWALAGDETGAATGLDSVVNCILGRGQTADTIRHVQLVVKRDPDHGSTAVEHVFPYTEDKSFIWLGTNHGRLHHLIPIKYRVAQRLAFSPPEDSLLLSYLSGIFSGGTVDSSVAGALSAGLIGGGSAWPEGWTELMVLLGRKPNLDGTPQDESALESH